MLLTLLRSLGSILLGYIVLAVTNMAFVILWFVRPMVDWPPISIALLSIPYTVVCGFAAGYLAAWVAGRHKRMHAIVLASLMGAVIVYSIVIDVAAEPTWYKWIYLCMMIPATLWGGYVRSQRTANAP